MQHARNKAALAKVSKQTKAEAQTAFAQPLKLIADTPVEVDMEEKWANFRKTASFFGEFRAGLDEPGRILLNSTVALSALCFVVLIVLGGFGTALFPLTYLGRNRILCV